MLETEQGTAMDGKKEKLEVKCVFRPFFKKYNCIKAKAKLWGMNRYSYKENR